MLFTKCILSQKVPEDGIRISVMSRHTLNDGITPDERIVPSSYDIHAPILAPSSKLIGDYYKRGLLWDDFEKRYLGEIRDGGNKSFLIGHLALMASSINITMLCIEDEACHCHRSILAKEFLCFQKELKIVHR